MRVACQAASATARVSVTACDAPCIPYILCILHARAAAVFCRGARRAHDISKTVVSTHTHTRFWTCTCGVNPGTRVPGYLEYPYPGSDGHSVRHEESSLKCILSAIADTFPVAIVLRSFPQPGSSTHFPQLIEYTPNMELC